jgi:hypothetical protein
MMTHRRVGKDAYLEAFTVRARMTAFIEDLSSQRGWTLAAGLLGRRFAAAFAAFLDAPNPANLAAVAAYATEIAHVDRQLAGSRPVRHFDTRRSGRGQP